MPRRCRNNNNKNTNETTESGNTHLDLTSSSVLSPEGTSDSSPNPSPKECPNPNPKECPNPSPKETLNPSPKETLNPSPMENSPPTPDESPKGSCDRDSNQDAVHISGVSLIIPEEPRPLQSFFKPHEMKRQIADALKEPGRTKRSQVRNKRTKANVNEFNALFGGRKSGKLSGPEVKQMLHYADVVRKNSNKENIFELGRLGKINEETEAHSLRRRMDCAIKEAMRENSAERNDFIEVDPENEGMPNHPKSQDQMPSEIKSQDQMPSEIKSQDQMPSEMKSQDQMPSVIKTQDQMPSLPTDPEDINASKKHSICQLLGGIDPEVLSELELDDTNWEVISIDGWSHCGSDTDDQFYLISRDDGLAMHSFDEDDDCEESDAPQTEAAKASETPADAKDSCRDKENDGVSCREPQGFERARKKGKQKKQRAGAPEEPPTPDRSSGGSQGGSPLKKKKVVVTRKYVGKEDFGEKLASLGFRPAADQGKQQQQQQWCGSYAGCEVSVSSRVLCGVLLITLRAEADTLLTGLTALQGLTADTGLLSYTSLSLPALQPAM